MKSSRGKITSETELELEYRFHLFPLELNCSKALRFPRNFTQPEIKTKFISQLHFTVFHKKVGLTVRQMHGRTGWVGGINSRRIEFNFFGLFY